MEKKNCITIKEEKIKCNWNKESGLVCIEGRLGKSMQVFKGEDIVFGENELLIKSKSSYGFFISRLKSLLEGVTKGYFIELVVIGRGYRFINLSESLLLKLGSMHFLRYKASLGIKIIGSRNKLVIYGLDLEEVRKVGAIIRGFKKPEVYKGKGINYVGEQIKLKIGKKS
jgi:large subunit ribosomal protein L6